MFLPPCTIIKLSSKNQREIQRYIPCQTLVVNMLMNDKQSSKHSSCVNLVFLNKPNPCRQKKSKIDTVERKSRLRESLRENSKCSYIFFFSIGVGGLLTKVNTCMDNPSPVCWMQVWPGGFCGARNDLWRHRKEATITDVAMGCQLIDQGYMAPRSEF